MAENLQFDLVQDQRGVIWDLLLYIPTVVALASISASFWYSDNHNMGYLFFFLTCFFFIAGFNRIFKTRLMLLPGSPITFRIGAQDISLTLRNRMIIDLVKNIRFYSDYAGKSFGISGLDGTGKQLQFVFHRGQFATPELYNSAQESLKQRFK